MIRPSLVLGLILAIAHPAAADKVEVLVQSAIHDGAARVRLQSMRMLDRAASRRAIPAFLSGLKDESASVRVVAVDAAKRFIGEPEILKAMELLREDPSPPVREHCKRALELAAQLAKRPQRVVVIHPVSAISKVPVPKEMVEEFRSLIDRALAHTPGVVTFAPNPYGFNVESAITKLSTEKTADAVQVTCVITHNVRRLPSNASQAPISGSSTKSVPLAGWTAEREKATQLAAIAGAVDTANEELLKALHITARH